MSKPGGKPLRSKKEKKLIDKPAMPQRATGNAVSMQPPNGLPLHDSDPNDQSDFNPQNYPQAYGQ